MLSVTVDVSKDVFQSPLARSRINKAAEKSPLLICKIRELDSETKAIEDISNLAADLHALAV